VNGFARHFKYRFGLGAGFGIKAFLGSRALGRSAHRFQQCGYVAGSRWRLHPNTYWPNDLPYPESGEHVSGVTTPEPWTDDLQVSSLAIKYDFADLSFQSDTSYLNRKSNAFDDFTHAAEYIFGGTPFVPGLSPSYSNSLHDANEFPDAVWIINKVELNAALAVPSPDGIVPANFDKYKTVKIRMIDGDYDVFGDGSVRILTAPGHTPGHQVLEIKLRKTRVVILSGDLYHLRANREFRRVPQGNASHADTLASMDRIETIVKNTGSRLVVQHDLQDFHALPQSFPPTWIDIEGRQRTTHRTLADCGPNRSHDNARLIMRCVARDQELPTRHHANSPRRIK
jgi:hypothetical protein